jgi:hypothetical protein
MRRMLASFLLAVISAPAATYYVTIAGLGGEPDYEQHFEMWASDIEKILKASGGEGKIETLKGAAATRAAITELLGKIAGEATAQDVLVVMLIGHGTFNGFDYKINLPGPDLSAADLAKLLDKIHASRQLVVNMTSASGGSINALTHPNRVLITATKTGGEKNATVFARYWLEALRDPAADTDKNDTISALEAFRYAQQKTANFYETQKRLATEHALLEDTGAGAGVRTPGAENGNGLRAAAFPLLRLGSAQAAAATPEKRKLFDKKEELEQEIDKLKYQKAAMPADEYKKDLEALLLELAKTQEELDK